MSGALVPGSVQPKQMAAPGHPNIGVLQGVEVNRDGIPESLQGRVVQSQRYVLEPRIVQASGYEMRMQSRPSGGVSLAKSTPTTAPQAMTPAASPDLHVAPPTMAPLVQEAKIVETVVAEPPPTTFLQSPRTAPRIPPQPVEVLQAPAPVFTEEYKQSICDLVMSNISVQFDDIFAKLEEHIDELYKRVTPEQIILLSERLSAVEAGSRQVKPNGNMEVTILQEEFRTGIREVRQMSEQMQFMPAKFEQIDKAILELEQNQWPMKDMENLGLLSRRVTDLEDKDQTDQRATREQIFEMKWSEAKMAELERKISMKPDSVVSQELVDQIYERVTDLEQKSRICPDEALLEKQRLERLAAQERSVAESAEQKVSSSSHERLLLELQEYVNSELGHRAKIAAEECKRVESRLDLVEQRLQSQLSELTAFGLSVKSQADVGQEYCHLYRLESLEIDYKERRQHVDAELEGLRHTLDEKQQFLSLLDQRLYEVTTTPKADALEVTKLESHLKDAVESLRYDLEESYSGNARAIIELHSKIARESANCFKMMTLQRDDILKFITLKQVWWIQVKICCAHDLKNSSHYCEIEVCRTGVQRHTRVLKGVSPEWDEEFSIPDYVPGDSLLFTIFESSTFHKTLVGKAELPGETIRRSGSFFGDLLLEELREHSSDRLPRLTVQASERLRSE